jgi:hypothetical protein
MSEQPKDGEVRAVEELSSKFHDIYMLEAKRQGDVRHKDKYEDLTENIKEFDRVLARYVLAYCEEAVKKERMRIETRVTEYHRTYNCTWDDKVILSIIRNAEGKEGSHGS